MKKLLLLSLLSLGATSFANTFQGTSKYVSVPIKITGELIDTANNKLIIETTQSTGIDGAALVFDFGKLDKAVAQTVSRSADFLVKKGNGKSFKDQTVKVGILTGTGVLDTDETTHATVAILGSSGGKIKYSVTSNAEAANKVVSGVTEINGNLKVDLTLGSNAEVGKILDTSKTLVAYIEA